MTAARVLAPEPTLTHRRHPFHDALLQMAVPVVDRIRAEVPAYAGPVGGRRHQLLSSATDAAIHALLEGPATRESARRKVDELFHRMGWGEAQDGNPPDHLHHALTVATRAAWDHLADHAVTTNCTTRALRDVTNEVIGYVDHLRAQLLAGHGLSVAHPRMDEQRARLTLLRFLRTTTAGRVSPLAPLGVDLVQLSELAEQARWPVPDQVVALAVSFYGDCPPVPQRPDLLWTQEGNRLQVLCAASAAEELAGRFERSGSDRRVVISWPVAPVEAGTALLWTIRALDLVQAGVIAPASVVRCEEHVTQLWLHSEPSMRKRLCQDLLQPLLAEAPNSREILSETLLVWLETRDSAPAIAARLDVHPQTVRYRWRRINELFGESLRNPEFVIQMTLVLKASVAMWKGGDQSDFELFRDTRDATG